LKIENSNGIVIPGTMRNEAFNAHYYMILSSHESDAYMVCGSAVSEPFSVANVILQVRNGQWQKY